MQSFPRNELLRNLSFECGTVRSVLRHGFHPPENQQGGSIQIAKTVHPQGRTPSGGQYCKRIYSGVFGLKVGHPGSREDALRGCEIEKLGGRARSSSLPVERETVTLIDRNAQTPVLVDHAQAH